MNGKQQLLASFVVTVFVVGCFLFLFAFINTQEENCCSPLDIYKAATIVLFDCIS